VVARMRDSSEGAPSRCRASRPSCSPFFLLLILVAGTSTVFGQSRVAIRPTPQAGQVVHITVEQEIVVRTGEKAEEPGPAQVLNKNVLAYTQANGTFDEQGRLEAKVTLERLEVDESLAGRPREAPDTSGLEGRVLAVTFDRTGKLLGIKIPPDITNNLSRRVTQVLAGAYGMLNFLPAVDLAPGEDTTSTSEFPMRLPGGTHGPIEARTNVTLQGIEKSGNDRIAHLQQRIDVATTTSQVTMSGGGTIDVNLDRGFVSGTNTEWIISGAGSSSAGAPQSPAFYGTIKISMIAK